MKSRLLIFSYAILTFSVNAADESAKAQVEIFKHGQTFGAWTVTSLWLCAQIEEKAVAGIATAADQDTLQQLEHLFEIRGETLVVFQP